MWKKLLTFEKKNVLTGMLQNIKMGNTENMKIKAN